MTFYNVKTKEDYDALMRELEAKGENMLNTECKQCHKKWHHDNAKYCSMCGKKLVDEPEFKVGDYISTTTNRYTGAVERIKEQDGVIAAIVGKLYDRYDGYVRETQLWGCDFRKPTPEEIAEYKAALNFYKHGRKPFEVKKDDVILCGDGCKLFIDNPNIWHKRDFTRFKYTLLKTSEEVNEWLGVADE